MDSASVSSNAAILTNHAGKILRLERFRTYLEWRNLLKPSLFYVYFLSRIERKKSATNGSSFSDSSSPNSLPSRPSPTSSQTPYSPTPDIMDCDESNNEARSSEPVTVSPTQEYVLPDHEDDSKLESGAVSNQGVLEEEPTSKSPVQEHLLHGTQADYETSVAMTVRRIVKNDDRQTTVSLSRNPALHPVTMVSEGHTSREKSPAAARFEIQQPQVRPSNRYSSYNWQQGNMLQTRDSSARECSSVDDKKRPRAEITYPKNNIRAGPDPSLCQNAPETTFDTVSHGRNVNPRSQLATQSLPKVPDTHWNQKKRLPPIDTRLPSFAELCQCKPSPVDIWSSRPNHSLPWLWPSMYESRHLQPQTPSNLPPQLVQGRTGHLGPPLKPLDNPKAEEIAQEQQRSVMRERELKEGTKLFGARWR